MVDLIHFNKNEFLEGPDLQERFGLRGRNMMQLAQLNTPIAPGFLIDAETVASGRLDEELTIEVLTSAVSKIEKLTNKTYNAPDRPMLFKAVASPSIQIGSIRSVHTIGINDEVAAGFGKYCGEEFAYHEYRHYLESFSVRFLGRKSAEFSEIDKANKKASHKDVCKLYRDKVVPDFPQNGYEQLRRVLTAMTAAYMDDPMNEGIEAAMLVQTMVYGNYGDKSYNGNFYSRDIVTGAPKLTGYFGHNEFDTLPEDAEDINKIDKKYLAELKDIATKLEEKFLDIRQIKFVIEESMTWVVEQNPVDAKSTQAEMRTLLDLHGKGLVSREKMITSIPPTQLQDLLHPVINHETTRKMKKVSGGIAGSPGAAVGRVAFSTRALLSEFRRSSLMGVNSDLILVMEHTEAEDVEAIEMGKAVIACGAYSSHAPVVSRSLRKPCLLYDDLKFQGGQMIMGGVKIKEFDTISLEVPTYTDPTVWFGKADLVYPDTAENGLEEFVSKFEGLTGDFRVYGNARNVNDIEVALKLGAEGIGTFPCDSLLMMPGNLELFREALLLTDPKKRDAALSKLETRLEKDFLAIFQKVGERKICIELLNAPLAEFLPHDPAEQKAVYKAMAKKHAGVSEDEFQNRASQLRNINPMLGQRGSRIAISYPDLYETLVAAIFQGAYACSKSKGKMPEIELLVPAVIGDTEMRFIRYGRNIEGTIIRGIKGVERDLMAKWEVKEFPIPYKVGASIELPSAALMGGHLAKQSDFFSIDTQMLTQTTNGMSYDDVNSFLPSYTQYDILKDNPFQILSTPVKELIATASHFGKMTRPDLRIGLSGIHASDPVNIDFAFFTQLNFVSCNPFGVPIAKLAVVQRNLERAKG
ncbi:MAG: pyruvate, phosphate dikinase [Candidatus Lambdaproteobacteria bacterium]|nr:pyruvate, phosphate dikinase [Candidatus Lambdaproteobacteria bacterium]